jgi:cystathionine beta-synthase/cysteine synthase A
MIMNILESIGNTPLIELQNSTVASEGKILLKYERNNPGGSIKDRPAIHIITEAERRGWLKPGGAIIESSSGNFGISLAMIGAAKGYRVIILVDPKTTAANLALLKCFGAEVIVVTEQDDSGSYHKTRISLANRLAIEIPNSFRPDQCFNLLNSNAHYQSTARENSVDRAAKI